MSIIIVILVELEIKELVVGQEWREDLKKPKACVKRPSRMEFNYNNLFGRVRSRG